jgi:hypothetical protein
MTTFNTSIGGGYSPATGKAVPATHMNRAFNNTLALKQGDQALDFLAGLQLDVTATGTQNDYTPGTGVIVAWNGASGCTITGLVAHIDGDIRVLRNITSAQLLQLSHQSGSSTAANRIITPGGQTVFIIPGGSATLQYDGTNDRWRVVSVNCYEEGTFTPTITSAGGGAPTYTTQVAAYVKKGRDVLATGKIQLATKGTLGAGAVSIAGLPYASENVTSQEASARFSNYALTTAVVALWGNMAPNATSFQMFMNTAAATSVTTMNVVDLSATSIFSFSINYKSAL